MSHADIVMGIGEGQGLEVIGGKIYHVDTQWVDTSSDNACFPDYQLVSTKVEIDPLTLYPHDNTYRNFKCELTCDVLNGQKSPFTCPIWVNPYPDVDVISTLPLAKLQHYFETLSIACFGRVVRVYGHKGRKQTYVDEINDFLTGDFTD